MTKQELLVILLMTSYTLVIVVGIHKYEARIKSLKESIGDYKRALSLSKHYSNASHYTQIQLNNADLRNTIKELDAANNLLQAQNKQLKQSLVESSQIQYESSTYKPYVNPYNNPSYKEIETLTEL